MRQNQKKTCYFIRYLLRTSVAGALRDGGKLMKYRGAEHVRSERAQRVQHTTRDAGRRSTDAREHRTLRRGGGVQVYARAQLLLTISWPENVLLLLLLLLC